MTHPVFVIRHVTQHVVQVQDASVSVFQPVDLDPVTGVLKKQGETVLALLWDQLYLHHIDLGFGSVSKPYNTSALPGCRISESADLMWVMW